MSRRGSNSSFSSSSDVNFDDLDDQQVFGYLEDDDARSPSPDSRSRRPSADFRLDFSRINSSRTPPSLSTKPITRKSLATSKPRSPSLTAQRRIVKRPSSLAISSVNSPPSQLFSQKRASSTANVWQATASSEDPDGNSFFELATTADAKFTACGEREDSVDVGQVSESKETPVSKPQKVKAAEKVTSGSGAVAPLGNANALVTALSSLQAQVELLTNEKTEMEGEVVSARTTIQNLEQKLAASEQSSDLFARQLENVKESFQAKLMAREEAVSLEKMTLAKEKETQLQQQQARFATEAELWKREIAALTKVKLELENENNRLHRELSDAVQQRGFVEAKLHTFKTEHTRTCEDLQMLLQQKERFDHAQVEIQELRSKMIEDLQHHELQRQQLEEQVNNLQIENEDRQVGRERERQVCLRQNEQEKSKLLRFAHEVRGLHHLLQQSVVEARELYNIEVKKTKDTLEGIQQQTSEFAVHQSDREAALMSRKGRIIQLETQLKNDRQTINQLEATLAKSTRALEKKHAALKVKFQEQKEYLEITLAVRQGLTTDLQTKRKQVTELEREVTRLSLAKGSIEVKLKHSQQQILAMQKVHGRELDKLTRKSLSTADFAQQENNDSKVAQHESPEDPEWLEFVQLVAAYEAERQLHTDLIALGPSY